MSDLITKIQPITFRLNDAQFKSLHPTFQCIITPQSIAFDNDAVITTENSGLQRDDQDLLLIQTTIPMYDRFQSKLPVPIQNICNHQLDRPPVPEVIAIGDEDENDQDIVYPTTPSDIQIYFQGDDYDLTDSDSENDDAEPNPSSPRLR